MFISPETQERAELVYKKWNEETNEFRQSRDAWKMFYYRLSFIDSKEHQEIWTPRTLSERKLMEWVAPYALYPLFHHWDLLIDFMHLNDLLEKNKRVIHITYASGTWNCYGDPSVAQDQLNHSLRHKSFGNSCAIHYLTKDEWVDGVDDGQYHHYR